jgi:hypothetical protein
MDGHTFYLAGLSVIAVGGFVVGLYFARKERREREARSKG